MVRLQVGKRTMYVNVRLIEITMGKETRCKPIGVQVVAGEGNVRGFGKQVLYLGVCRDNLC